MFGLLLLWARRPCTRLGVPPGDASRGPALLLQLGWGCRCVQGRPCCRRLRVPSAHACRLISTCSRARSHMDAWGHALKHTRVPYFHSESVDTRAPSVSQDLHGHTHMCAHISIRGSPGHWWVHTACHTHTGFLSLSDTSTSLHRAPSPSSLSAVTVHLQKGTRAPRRRPTALLLPRPRSESTMSPSRLAQPPPGLPSPSPRLR